MPQDAHPPETWVQVFIVGFSVACGLCTNVCRLGEDLRIRGVIFLQGLLYDKPPDEALRAVPKVSSCGLL